MTRTFGAVSNLSRSIGTSFLLSLVLVLLSTGVLFAHDNVVVSPDGSLHGPVEVQLSASHPPRPGEIVDLSMSATPHMAASQMTIRWQVGEGVELLGGEITERIDGVATHQGIQRTQQVRFPGEGVFQVSAIAEIRPSIAAQYGEAATLYFTIKADGTSSISDYDPTVTSPMHSTMETTIQQISPQIVASQTSDDPCFTIRGKITRLERTPALTPTNTPTHTIVTDYPVRYAHVTLWEEDLISDDRIGDKITDVHGEYRFDFCDNDGIGDDQLELYLVLEASLYDPDGFAWDDFEVVYVEDSSYIDETYEYTSKVITPPSGGDYRIDMKLDSTQSIPFNIADAIFDGWQTWTLNGGASGGDESVDITAEVHWEPGYIEEPGNPRSPTTFYEGVLEEITVSDNSLRRDQWDDSAILHEYGHMITDNYSCDESLGGPHNFNQILNDPEFAWSEGFNDYFQSMVRRRTNAPNPNVYFDLSADGSTGAAIDLETWDVTTPNGSTAPVISVNNEMALAAMFWDLEEDTTDGQDKVSHGPAMIQKVYTDDEFNSQWGDEECTVNEYFRAWQALGNPADGATAAVIGQNTGAANPFSTVNSAATNSEVEFSTADVTGKLTDYQWWKHLILVNDLSKSMAGTEINAVKTVLNEQINDIAQSPKGVEFSIYSFDNTKASNTTLLTNKFYANLVTPTINSMTTSSSDDPNCVVESLRAMAQAVGSKQKGDAWLFTDGDAPANSGVDALVKSLNNHKIKGSIALLGGCGTLPPSPTNVTGATKNYLGLAANASQQSGIVPYLLTALGSGGQFLYVDSGKFADSGSDVADILRAQLSHSAGAGRWSDYVSDNPTYLYDKLPSWEYKWIDATQAAGGTNQGTPNKQTSVNLPTPFSFYGASYTAAQVTRYGYLTFGAAQTPNSVNTALPSAATPNNALYILWDDLPWNDIPALAAAGNQPDQPNVLQANVFSKQEGDWFAISTIGSTLSPGELAYQILLNSKTGEIRYQYKSNINSSSATIGLENNNGTLATQVSLNDINGAKDGMGYKFIPAPAQPSKTFTASVDGLMSSVAFLLSGYSGTFDDLDVRTPDNSQVNCADTANVLCLNLGSVQYVQVKVNGRRGIWKATVSAGPSGAGTFSLNTIGASSITAQSSSDRTLATGNQVIAMRLEKAVAGNQLQGWFTRPNGQPFGSNFRFYDDGAHNDGAPGDGRFGSDNFAPPSPGVAYLWIKGAVDGESFVRSDPTPFNFQPLEVLSLGDGKNFGDKTTLVFSIHNLDSVAHCYDRTTQLPNGWGANWNFTIEEFTQGLCLTAGQSVTRAVDIHMGALPNELPSSANGEVVVTFIEKEEGTISDSASATITRYRPAASMVISNKSLSTYLRPTGVDTTTLQIFVYDDQNVSVADGTEVKLSSSLGTIPAVMFTNKGHADPTFTAGLVSGSAIITAVVDSLVATTTVLIQSPVPDALTISSDKSQLAANENSAKVTVTLRDQWGNPAANQPIRLSISGDGEMGQIDGAEVITLTTNTNGDAVATFTRGTQSGIAIVDAGLVVTEEAQTHLALESYAEINVQSPTSQATQKVYLPLVSR